MKFSFSPLFRQSLYEQLLRALGLEIDAYRQLSGITVKELMDHLHMSHHKVRMC